MDYDAFISYAHADGLDAAQSLKTSLKRAYFDQHGNRAAGEWEKKIRGAIQDSTVFCFLITPASITSDYCQQEWTWAREAAKPIISIMVEEVYKTKIAEKYHDFYDTVHAVQYIHPDEAPAWQRYHLHLQTVYREFDRAIHFATQAVTFIDIPTEQKVQYIQPEADAIFIRMVETPGKNEACSLEAAWAQYSGRVLLLGDPGAGKTTMLLHHAKDLIAAYLRDPNQRMPFYTSIAQWDSYADQPLAEWFAEKYKLPTSITRYIEHGEAVLILDGLDELGSSRPIDPKKPEGETFDPRQRFMAQVQRAVDSGNDVLITCRVKDYEAIGELFAEMGAVQLHALNDDQIQTYLNNFPTVQTALMDDPALLDICRSPLLLRLIAFGYRDAPADLQGLGSMKEGALRDAIFGQYITTSYAYEARRRADRGETMPFTLDKMLEVLGHTAMINASGGMRNDMPIAALIGSDIIENVLVPHDFIHRLDDDQISVFCDLGCELHILHRLDGETLSFLHLLLRDHLAYVYSVKHLHNHDVYGKTYHPSPARALGGVGDTRAVELLTKALADVEWRVIQAATVALGRLGESALQPLRNALRHENPVVRTSAAKALGELGDARAIKPLINALSDANWEVSKSASDALGQLGDRALPPLLIALKHKNADVRKFTADALWRLGDVRSVEPLMYTLTDKESKVRYAAARALGGLRDTRAIPALIERLGDTEGPIVPWDRVCDKASESLEKIGILSVEPLIGILAEANSDVRWNVINILGRLGDVRAVEPLINTLTDIVPRVRRLAANVLGKLGDVRAVAPLIDVLPDKDTDVRRAVVRALGQLGDGRAIPALIERLADTEELGSGERVCDAAADALLQIGTPEALAAVEEWERNGRGRR